MPFISQDDGIPQMRGQVTEIIKFLGRENMAGNFSFGIVV